MPTTSASKTITTSTTTSRILRRNGKTYFLDPSSPPTDIKIGPCLKLFAGLLGCTVKGHAEYWTEIPLIEMSHSNSNPRSTPLPPYMSARTWADQHGNRAYGALLPVEPPSSVSTPPVQLPAPIVVPPQPLYPYTYPNPFQFQVFSVRSATPTPTPKPSPTHVRASFPGDIKRVQEDLDTLKKRQSVEDKRWKEEDMKREYDAWKAADVEERTVAEDRHLLREMKKGQEGLFERLNQEMERNNRLWEGVMRRQRRDWREPEEDETDDYERAYVYGRRRRDLRGEPHDDYCLVHRCEFCRTTQAVREAMINQPAPSPIYNVQPSAPAPVAISSPTTSSRLSRSSSPSPKAYSYPRQGFVRNPNGGYVPAEFKGPDEAVLPVGYEAIYNPKGCVRPPATSPTPAAPVQQQSLPRHHNVKPNWVHPISREAMTGPPGPGYLKPVQPFINEDGHMTDKYGRPMRPLNDLYRHSSGQEKGR